MSGRYLLGTDGWSCPFRGDRVEEGGAGSKEHTSGLVCRLYTGMVT